MRTTLAITTMMALAAAAQAQSFFGLGSLETPEGLGLTDSAGISADGLTVYGQLQLKNNVPEPAFRWTADEGLQSIGFAWEGDWTYATDISVDGSVIVGYTGGGSGANRAWRWSAASGYSYLTPLLLDQDATAKGVSGDGTFVAGNSYGNNARVVRWNASGLVQDIGIYPGHAQSYARTMAADGRTVIGWTTGGGLDGMHPFSWSDIDGWKLIPMAPGVNGASPTSTIADGTVIVGFALTDAGERPFRWTESGGMELLAVPPGANGAYGASVSADGNTVVGRAYYDSAVRACLWSAGMGMVDLKDYFTSLGLDLTGWELSEASGTSADGFTITGTGMHNGEQEAWVAVIPGPASVVPLLFASVLAPRRRLALTGTCGAPRP